MDECRQTDGQTVDNQLRELQMVAERNGWQIVQEFVDKGISGAKGLEQRPEEIEQEMLTQGATACIQKAFSLDQLGSALQEVLPSPTQADS